MPRRRLRMLRRSVRRTRDGSFVLRLDDDEVELLAALAEQLDPLLDDPSADPALRRLFPPAHPDDLLAEAEWEIQQGGRLRDSRRAALAALRRAAGEPLSEAELVAWVQGVNSLRLVLAERLGVTGDDAVEQAALDAAMDAMTDGSDEAARQVLGAWQLYELLAWMVDGASRALDDAEPDVDDADDQAGGA